MRRSPSLLFSSLLITATLAIAAAPTRARAEALDEDTAAAKLAFERGTRSFSLGEFGEAVAQYKQAYKLRPQAVFLYNIAQAYRLAGDATQALFFYRSYLQNAPTAPNRSEVEDRIRKLDAQVAQQSAPPNIPIAPPTVTKPAPVEPKAEPVVAAAPEPTPAVAATAPAPRQRRPAWFWGVIGGTAGLVVVGLAVGLGVGLNPRYPSRDIGTVMVLP